MNLKICRFFYLFVLSVGTVILWGACTQNQTAPRVEIKTIPLRIGTVSQVYPEHKYVLISLSGKVYPPGTVLISQSSTDGELHRVANLCVSEERLDRRFIPADIRSGTVQVGDLVYLYKGISAPNIPMTPGNESAEEPVEEPAFILDPSDTEVADVTTPDGLLPMEEQVDTAKQTEIDKKRAEQREKILKQLEDVPGKLNFR